jgi:sialate O-acetylesterase
MVLQRDLPIKLWGKADNGEAVSVTLNGQTVKTKAGRDGVWRVQLKAMPYGGPYGMTIKGKNTITLRNILIGDIWVCSGQSNMEWTVARSNNAETEIANADYPEIRLLSINKKMSNVPLQEANTKGWAVCSPQTVGNFSAVGYFLGRELHRQLDIPIGLVNASWGGTNIETWTSIPMMQTQSEYAQKMDMLPSMDMSTVKDPNVYPSLLYNAMIAPLTYFPVKGAIWYQGENNAMQAYKYRTSFPNMITDWRNAWNQGDFPFYFVQLSSFETAPINHTEYSWAELREAQHLTLRFPNTGEAVTIDIGEANDIHPRNKQDVGLRLALNALAKTYGKNIEFSGPEYKAMKTDGNKIILTFTHADGGLIAKGRYGYLYGFSIAGDDRKFVWAKAHVEGNTVVVYSNEVNRPVAVRYAWLNNPEDANLYNSDGLPASPFRTDDWK